MMGWETVLEHFKKRFPNVIRKNRKPWGDYGAKFDFRARGKTGTSKEAQ